ncbi:MAG: flagellar motor switch protein FliN [Candidatus Margulisiibacteriota bacterium]|jgi:flagellar motor switch protein FliN/FliY
MRKKIKPRKGIIKMDELISKTPKKRSKKVLDAGEVSLQEGVGQLKEKDDMVAIGGVSFPELDASLTGESFNKGMFAQIPIKVSVELGQTKLSLQEVLELKEGSIIELDRLAGEPLDLVVNGQLIARGEVVAIDDNYGLRITEVLAKK